MHCDVQVVAFRIEHAWEVDEVSAVELFEVLRVLSIAHDLRLECVRVVLVTDDCVRIRNITIGRILGSHEELGCCFLTKCCLLHLCVSPLEELHLDSFQGCQECPFSCSTWADHNENVFVFEAQAIDGIKKPFGGLGQALDGLRGCQLLSLLDWPLHVTHLLVEDGETVLVDDHVVREYLNRRRVHFLSDCYF